MTNRHKNQMAMSGTSVSLADDPLAKQRMVFCITACVVLGLGVTLACLHLPGPPCLVRLMCHIPCPGCGLTRSFKALCCGDIVASFRYYPLGLPLFVILTAYAVAIMAGGPLPYLLIVRDHIEAAVSSPKFWIGMILLWIGVWAMRIGLAWAGNSYFCW